MFGWLFNGMARVSAFTVHEPPQAGGTKLDRAESLLFVGDGFSWRAALFSPLYLLMRGEWVMLAAYAAAAAVLWAILALAGADSGWYAWAFILLNVIVGFELSEVKRWSLGRAGWSEIATVSGRGQEEAERRFFDVWLPSIPAGTPRVESGAPHGTRFTPHIDVAKHKEAVQRLATRLRSKFLLKT